MLGGAIEKNGVIRDAPSINVRFGSLQLIIRGKRPGESPSTPKGIKHFDKFLSHNEWGMNHFAFTYNGDLKIWGIPRALPVGLLLHKLFYTRN